MNPCTCLWWPASSGRVIAAHAVHFGHWFLVPKCHSRLVVLFLGCWFRNVYSTIHFTHLGSGLNPCTCLWWPALSCYSCTCGSFWALVPGPKVSFAISSSVFGLLVQEFLFNNPLYPYWEWIEPLHLFVVAGIIMF